MPFSVHPHLTAVAWRINELNSYLSLASVQWGSAHSMCVLCSFNLILGWSSDWRWSAAVKLKCKCTWTESTAQPTTEYIISYDISPLYTAHTPPPALAKNYYMDTFSPYRISSQRSSSPQYSHLSSKRHVAISLSFSLSNSTCYLLFRVDNKQC